MSRKDTIIIALLVNAGLLALLFMLAVNTDDGTVNSTPEINQSLAEAKIEKVKEVPPPVLAANAPVDIDTFLKDMPTEEGPAPIIMDEDRYVELTPETPVVVKAAPAKRESVSLDSDYVEVTVKRGDALEKIARANGTSVEAIKKANNLSSTKLSIGQVLKVPVSTKSVATKPATEKPAPVAQKAPPPQGTLVAQSSYSDAEYYTIKSGDSPWKIAKQFNINFDDLLRLNNLNEEKARNLKVGERIRIK